jgi:hypothetical protein
MKRLKTHTMPMVLMVMISFAFYCSSPNGWRPLLNGKDLSGWKVYGTEKYYMQNGELVCESGPEKSFGYLATEETFKDFELKVEFKQEAGGNSGIFFRCSVEGTVVNGWQTEVAPPGEHSGGVYESYGRGWRIKPDMKKVNLPDLSQAEKYLNMPDPDKEKHLKMGEWNEMKLRVVGDRVTTWLNGHKMVDFEDEKIGQAKGSIALQVHKGGGVKVYWRNIFIREINEQQ